MFRKPGLAWLLVVCLIFSCTNIQYAQEQSTDYVPKEAFAAIIVNIDVLKKTPDSDYFPHEIVSALGKQNYGIELTEIKSAKMIFGINDDRPQDEPKMGVILEFKKNFDLAEEIKEQDSTVVDGTEIFYDRNMGMHMVQTAPKSIIFATSEPFALVMAASKNVKNPFTKLLANAKSDKMFQVLVSVEKLKPVLQNVLSEYPAPPPFGSVNKLHDQIKSMDLTTNMLGGIDLELVIKAHSDGDARKVEKTIKHLLKLAKASVLAGMAAMVDSEDIVQQAQYDYAQRISDKLESELTPARKGDTLTIKFKNDIANVGVLTALLLPAVQAAREAARRTQSSNGVRQMTLSFHNYHDAKGKFPGQAITDKKGNKLLSWRVEVLPFLGYQELYDEFRKDEPWDSEHNIKLLDKMPDVFRNPNVPESNETNYLAVTGKGTAFDGSGGKKISDFRDGTSNSVMFVEADKTVPWTKPADFEVDWDDPLAGLGNVRPGIFLIGLADGSTTVVSETIDAETLKSMFRINDGK